MFNPINRNEQVKEKRKQVSEIFIDNKTRNEVINKLFGKSEFFFEKNKCITIFELYTAARKEIITYFMLVSNPRSLFKILPSP